MSSSPPFAVIGVDHVGFAVSSLDASIRFWVEGLGGRLLRTGEMSGTFLAQVTGAQGARVRTAIIDISGHRVELIQYSDAPPHRGDRSRPYHAGFAHLALNVTDLDAAIAGVARYGWCPQGTPQVIEQGPKAGTRVMYVLGPDGEMVELLQPPDLKSE